MDEIKKDILILIAALTTIVVLPPVLFVLYYMLCVCFSGIKLSISNLQYINTVNFTSELKQNIIYRYGSGSKSIEYTYDTSKKEIIDRDFTSNKLIDNDIKETCIDYETGDEYSVMFEIDSKSNISEDIGIRHINKKKEIDEIILYFDDIKKHYGIRGNIYIDQLTYVKEKKQLIFKTDINSLGIICYDILNNIFYRITTYKSFLYFNYTEDCYFYKDKIYVINL